MSEERFTVVLQSILDEFRQLNRNFAKQLRTNRCTTSIINLTVAHVNIPLGIKYDGRVYLLLDVERNDSPFTYRLGQPSTPDKSEVFTAPTGLFFHEFTEIYITNAAALGIAIILTGWYE